MVKRNRVTKCEGRLSQRGGYSGSRVSGEQKDKLIRLVGQIEVSAEARDRIAPVVRP